MKKEFVTLKEALPGFVAECIKVVNRENATLEDFHVDDKRSLNYYLKRFIVWREQIWRDEENNERTRSMLHDVLQHAYKAIDLLFRDDLCGIFYYRWKLLDTEGVEIYCDWSSLINGVMLYIYEMLDEDNFNLIRLTSGAWHEEYQSNDIYRGLKNDKELADLANRKVWRLWTEDDDDKEVEDVEKEEAGKEEAGKEITSGELSPQEIIDKYFSVSYSTLVQEQMEKAVKFCGDTKSNLAILEFVIKDINYTSCISRHKLFLQTLDAMGIKKYDDDTYDTMKEKYRLLKKGKNEWSEEDKEKYAALMKIFGKQVLINSLALTGSKK